MGYLLYLSKSVYLKLWLVAHFTNIYHTFKKKIGFQKAFFQNVVYILKRGGGGGASYIRVNMVNRGLLF